MVKKILKIYDNFFKIRIFNETPNIKDINVLKH